MYLSVPIFNKMLNSIVFRLLLKHFDGHHLYRSKIDFRFFVLFSLFFCHYFIINDEVNAEVKCDLVKNFDAVAEVEFQR